MSQGPLCPNLSQKVQKEVSQMANRNLPCAMLKTTGPDEKSLVWIFKFKYLSVM